MATPAPECGGPHSKTSKPVNDGKDSHHTPAKDSYKHTKLDKNDGPAIKMDPADHRRTASNGSMPGSDVYRNKQKALIDQGKFKEAIQMDVDDIKGKFPGKYDACLDQMLAYADTIDPKLLKP
jgi:filamentous hemagglutinin